MKNNISIDTILNSIKNSKLSYCNELLSFVSHYNSLTIQMEDNELNSYLHIDGYNTLYNTISNLTERNSYKVIGFINYYEFMLGVSIRNDDKYNILDLLYAIPNQFDKDIKIN